MPQRDPSFDIARGGAMLLVCVSHFATHSLAPTGWARTASLLNGATMVASPAFVLISGMIFGVRRRQAPARVAEFRRLLLDRALFLLTVGHLVLAIPALLVGSRSLAKLAGMSFVTDAVAVAIVVGPAVAVRTSHRVRLLVALVLYAAAWGVVYLWRPEVPLYTALRARLVGDPRLTSAYFSSFPVAQWLAWYLLGTILGERHREPAALPSRADWKPLLRLGTNVLAVAVPLKLLLLALRYGVGFKLPDAAYPLVGLQKWPPGPMYLALFGGGALCFVALTAQLGQIHGGRLASKWCRALGGASFAGFVVQALVYEAALPSLQHRFLLPDRLWPVYLLLSIVIVVAVAAVWQGRDLNRLLTVGLAPHAGRARSTPRTPDVAGERAA